MGVATALRFGERVPTASRLAAIRNIVELAESDEDRDVAVDELLILGVSRDELTVAMFDDPAEPVATADGSGAQGGVTAGHHGDQDAPG
jgi:hypothetical protein